jgi:hypothetical protein
VTRVAYRLEPLARLAERGKERAARELVKASRRVSEAQSRVRELERAAAAITAARDMVAPRPGNAAEAWARGVYLSRLGAERVAVLEALDSCRRDVGELELARRACVAELAEASGDAASQARARELARRKSRALALRAIEAREQQDALAYWGASRGERHG